MWIPEDGKLLFSGRCFPIRNISFSFQTIAVQNHSKCISYRRVYVQSISIVHREIASVKTFAWIRIRLQLNYPQISTTLGLIKQCDTDFRRSVVTWSIALCIHLVETIWHGHKLKATRMDSIDAAGIVRVLKDVIEVASWKTGQVHFLTVRKLRKNKRLFV